MSISTSIISNVGATAKFPISRALPVPFANTTASPPATPLVKELSALANETLLKPTGKSHALHRDKIELLNQHFAWKVAEIGALFSAIYSQGVVTDQDPQKMEVLQRDLDHMEKEIGALPAALQQAALTKLKKLRTNLNKVQQFSERLQEHFPYLERIEEARGMLAVDDSGKALLVMEAIPAAVKALIDCEQKVASEGGEKARLQWSFERERNFTSLALLDLMESAEEAMDRETAYLKKALKTAPTDERSTINRQIRALHEQESRLLIMLRKEQDKVKDHPELKVIAERLQEASQSIRKRRNAWSKWKPELGLPPLAYGSEEWRALMPEKPVEQKGIALFDPENWSDRTKDVVYRILAGVQLFQQGVSIAGQLRGRDERLKKEANRLQAHVAQALPPEIVNKIKTKAHLMGTLLSDMYDDLHKESSFNARTRNHPEIRPALREALATFGTEHPSTTQISDVMDNFIKHQLIQNIQASPMVSPFQALTFKEWWEIFNPTEKIPEKKEESPVILALPATPVGHEVAKIESAGNKTSNWLSKMVGSVGSFLAPAAPSYTDQVVEKRTEGAERLGQSLVKLTDLQNRLQEDVVPNLGELRQHVALMHRELLKNVQDAPHATCPLPQLASWLQKVDDTCYGVALMEKRLAALMEPARGAISQEDSQLLKGGQKHANLIKQVRLVEALQIPGVIVPRPHEIPSDRVEAFCRAHAPELFDNWKKLGELYAKYQGEEPFLQQTDAKELLENIDKALEQVFKSAGENEELWHELLPPDLLSWLETVKANGDYLMVRSTGAEDSRQTANAGGNVSRAYVSPEQKSLAQSLGDVVRSYFGYGSLQNRLNAKLNPFEQELKMAVTTQQLIGEEIGGSKDPSKIPVSLVLFTSEPLYVGGERFRTMRVSATYGHGEGVVGNMGIATDTALLLISEANPDKIYVLYDNQPKPDRLAPVATPEGVKLQKIANSPALKQRPALNEEILHRLYTWGVIGEKFFDDHPTDMEIVIKGNTIFPVQARPVNRPDLLPTYLDLRKIDALKENPIVKKVQAEMLVPGQASVVSISHPNEIHIAKTLEEAEKTFRQGQHKLVVVTQQEPANSHPVVNFSGLGMPCLVVKSEEEARQLVQKVDKTHSLAVDMQAATINLWDQSRADVTSCISNGFTVHPAKIAISLPLSASLPLAKGPAKVPQDVKDLVLSLRAATTQDVALAKIEELRQHGFVKAIKERQADLEAHLKELKFVPAKAQQTQRMFESLDRKLKLAFDEAAAVWKKGSEERLHPLFHAKEIETLLLGSTGARGYGQYSVVDVEPIYQDIKALVEYQKGLSHPAHFPNLFLMGSEALIPKTEKAWRDFLAELEPLVEQGTIPKDQAVQFRKMIGTLHETKMLSTWFALFFPAIDRPDISAKEKLEIILKTLPPGDAPFLEKILSLNHSLREGPRHLELLANPARFEEGWKWVLSHREMLGWGSELRRALDNASPLSRMIALKSMHELVDTMDRAIKAVKGSKEWPEQAKIQQFRKMLSPYLILLKSWGKNVVKDMPMLQWQTVEQYLDTLEYLYSNRMSDNAARQLSPSPEFSVAAAMMDARTRFERHVPQTLEDMFTLIHQNLIACVNNVGNSLYTDSMMRQAHLPDQLKTMLNQFDEKQLGRPIQRIALEISNDAVMAKYNVPLRNHSAQLVLMYDRMTDEISLKGLFLGEGRERWLANDLLVAILDKKGILPVMETPHKTEQEFTVSWRIEDERSLAIAFQEFNYMCELSLVGSEVGMINDLKARRGLTDIDVAVTVAQMAREGNMRVLGNLAMLDDILPHSDVETIKGWVRVATQGSVATSGMMRERAGILIEKLADKGVSPEIFAEAIKNAINARVLSPVVLKKLVQNGHISEPILEAAIKGLKSDFQNIHDQSLEILREMVQKGRRYPPAMEYVMKGIHDPSLKLQALSLELFASLVEEGKNEEEALEAAKIGIGNRNPGIRSKAVGVFNALIDRGKGLELALEMAPYELWYFQEHSMQLYELLMSKGLGLDAVLNEAKKGSISSFPDVRAVSFTIYENLVSRGRAFAEASEAAKLGLLDIDVKNRHKARGLLMKLVEKGQAYEIAFESVETGMSEPDAKTRELSIDLLIDLFKAGYAREKALEITVKGTQDTDPDVRLWAFSLLYDMIENGIGHEAAIKAASKGLQDSASSVRGFSKSIFRSLLEQGKGFQEAAAAVASVMSNPKSDENAIGDALSVLYQLIEKGEINEATVKYCVQAMKNSSESNRIFASNLLGKLVEKRYGVKEALASVKQAVDQGRKEEITYLISALVKQGAGFDVALSVAPTSWEKPLLSLRLYHLLVMQGQGYEAALDRVNAEIRYRPEARELSLQILKQLLKKGVGHQTAKTLAEQWISHPDINNRREALALSRLSVSQGQSMETGIEIARRASSDPVLRDDAFLLFQEIVEKGHGYEAAKENATSALKDPEVRENGLILLERLVKMGQAYDISLEAMKSGINDADWRIRNLSLDLLHSLVEKGQGYDVALEVIQKKIGDESRREALLGRLRMQGYPI